MRRSFVEQYTAALRDYLSRDSLAVPAEAALAHAYDLGRRAIDDGLGVLDLAAAHQEAVAAALSQARTREESVQTVRRASIFLGESLSPFEMTHRGFQETIAKLLDANEALRESEAKNRALLNVIPDVLFRLRKDGTCLDFKAGADGKAAVSPAVSPDDLVGRQVSEVLPAALARQIMRHVEQALQTGDTQIFEYQQGSRHPWPALTPYPSPTGRGVGGEGVSPQGEGGREYEVRIVVSGKDEVLAIVRDITERKRLDEERARLIREQAARAEVEAAERRFAFLAEASETLASSFDYEATLASVARLAVPYLADWGIVDVVEDQVIRRLAVACADPSREELARTLHRHAPDPAGSHPILHVLHTGQSALYPQASPSLLLTENRLAENRLPENRAGGHDGGHAELIQKLGVTSGMLVPIVARGRALGAFTFVAAESKRQYTPADLSLAENLAGRAALAIENARLYRVVLEALRVRDEFIAAAAHELRTPVTVIKGWAEALLKARVTPSTPYPLPPPGGPPGGPPSGPPSGKPGWQQALETIVQQSARITRVTDDLLEVVRLRTGPPALSRARFDLSALVEESVTQMDRLVETHQVRATTFGPLAVDADRPRISEVLRRLLENALRYSPRGAPIEVEARRVDGEAVVSVRDRGVGISPERQPHIFEPFYEPVPGGWPGYVGIVSLGLPLSKQIVQAHGGRIWFVSTPGQGSTFSFSLPLAPESD